MKNINTILIASLLAIVLSACSSRLSPRQAFSEMNALTEEAVVVLENVTDIRSAHQASQKLDAIATKFDETTLNIEPFNEMSGSDADAIIARFVKGRETNRRLLEVVGKLRRNSESWTVLESSVQKLGGAMERGAIVMGSYVEALPVRN